MQGQLAKEGVPGDLAEIAVFQGHTASLLVGAARRLAKTFYLSDSFGGFDARDVTGSDSGKRLLFADISLAAVRARGRGEHTLHARVFQEAAAALPGDARFGLVHIDCDLYAPITSAREYFCPRMSPGGFILVHDYPSMGWDDGAERAIDELPAD